MGAWGVHSFENDTALDWVSGKLASHGAAAISSAFADVLDSEGDVDLDAAQVGVAAVGVLAAALGRGRLAEKVALTGLPEISDADAKTLVQNANYVIMRVTGGSELRNLWEDAEWGDRDAWLASLTDLRSRVNGDVVSNTGDVASVAPHEISLEDVRGAISGLDARLSEVQAEIMEALARLARKVEALER